MNEARNKLVDEIYSEALTLSADARGQFVAERCDGNEQLLQQVNSLLQASEVSDDLLADQINGVRERLWKSILSDDVEAGEDLSNQRIANWLLLERIARGGLATVYKAERADDAYDQTVAFKVMRRGLDTDDLISRFRAERQILSSLEHPSIAQILDGGALEDGRPYLVLEYVDGVPITRYCESQKVNLRDCVVLLIKVLRALHHAHQHLVVHRDVKPSNILVSSHGNVTLLDFGIAKLLDPQSMPGASTATRTGVSLLTPGYGSPEQHAGEAITTASDIYQVGIVMYEILTGKRPFKKSPSRDGPDPSLPSRILQGSPRGREVRGDLDAITRKAMHVEPTQRYASADEMIEDLKRFLNGLPVIARPDTVRYRFTKLAKRRPWLMPVMVLLIMGVAAYVTTLTVYSKRLAREEQLAATSQQFLIDLFRSPDPFAPADAERGRAITVVEALGIGQKRIRHELSDQPELRASLLRAISEVYASLDDGQTAIELREEALELELGLYGNRSPQVVASMRALGGLYGGSGDMDKANLLLEEQLVTAADIFEQDSAEVGLAEIAVGLQAQQAGDMDKSRVLLMSGVEKLRPHGTKYARKIISALLVSAEHYGMESQVQAMAAIRDAEEIANNAFGESSVQATSVRIRLASTMTMYGDFEGSEKNFLAAIPVLERQLGPEHSSTLGALNNLGYLYSRSKAEAKGEEIHRELLERRIAKNGPSHRSVGDSYQNLAGVITKQGRYDESVPLHRKAYDIYKSVLNDDNYMIAFPLLSISYAELQRARGAAAETAAREALSRFEASVPGTFLEGVARCLVGLSLEQQGKVEEGSALVDASHDLMNTGSIPDPYPALCRMPGS